MEQSNYLRSEVMSLIQLYLPSEMGHASIAELGKLGVIQFRDLNPQVNHFQRAYTGFIKRLDDMERKLQLLIKESKDANILLLEPSTEFLNTYVTVTHEMDDLEERLNEFESRILQMNQSFESLLQKLMELVELKHILSTSSLFFGGVSFDEDNYVMDHHQYEKMKDNYGNYGSEKLSLFDQGISDHDSAYPSKSTDNDLESLHRIDGKGLENNLSGSAAFSSRVPGHLGLIAGVIPRSKAFILENVLWRALRGNLYMNMREIDELILDPSSKEPIKKCVFIISSHGIEMLSKTKKLATSLGANLYTVDDNSIKRREMAFDVLAQIEELNSVLYNTKLAKDAELMKVSDFLLGWLLLIRREKSIYHTLNLCNYDANKKCLIAEGWTPRNSIPVISASLQSVSQKCHTNIVAILNEIPIVAPLTPPTYNKTNKFTRGFQELVDAYGIASYREINPALFTVITFPFLFAVMFGDFGHGVFLTALGLWLVLSERKLSKVKGGEMWDMLYGGRYIILLLGIFSMYTGLIYNDIFSKAFKFFPSAFTFNATGYTQSYNPNYVYPFGIDWGWIGATNSLTFLNSYKMKQAILLGIGQMNFGIFLSFLNLYYFSDYYGIVGVCIPQFLFMTSIFGYLGIMIIYKWIVQTDASPSLLNMLISMVLSPGTVKAKDQFYSGQAYIQLFLLMIAVICVPWMLLYKPLMLRRKHKRESGNMLLPAQISFVDKEKESVVSAVSGSMSSHQEFDFAEEMIHQGIHTIEFVLGSVSNTASYLRLWALSLAHSQLSEVLWSMVVERTAGSILLTAVGFAVWLILTLSILVVMEGLSAFLHALRLHWVEFNNKFYQGSGYKFEPFSYKEICAD